MIGAIINDTWQQSKQQGVFIFMLAVMAVILLGGVALPRTFVDADGGKSFGTVLSDRPVNYFSQQWVNAYAETLDIGVERPSLFSSWRNARRGGFANQDNDGLTRQQQRQQQIQQLLALQAQRTEAVNAASSIPTYQRSVEYYVNVVVSLMFTVSLLLFIAASAGYFPALLTSGAVDIVLSKPISRLKIFSGKYLGGMVLYAGAIFVFMVLLYVGIGVRTGIWHARIFLSMPLLIFIALVLYAVLALIGTWSKSATMALVLGYVLYLVVDSLLGVLLDFQPVFQELGWESVDQFCSFLRFVTPNFGIMKDIAVASILNVPSLQITPFVVAVVWLFACLGGGYWIFARRDF